MSAELKEYHVKRFTCYNRSDFNSFIKAESDEKAIEMAIQSWKDWVASIEGTKGNVIGGHLWVICYSNPESSREVYHKKMECYIPFSEF